MTNTKYIIKSKSDLKKITKLIKTTEVNLKSNAEIWFIPHIMAT